MSLAHSDVLKAAARLAKSGRLYRTPTFECPALNKMMGGNRIFFKCENLQRIGAFKSRGALNTILSLHERGEVPPRVVAYSSGNHAQAVSWACAESNIPCTIFMPDNVSPLKAAATASYGAEVVLSPTRPESEALAQKAVEEGAFLIPPFDHDDVITGQGTACLEALQDLESDGVAVDAVIAPVGGGGLISGTYLAAQGFRALNTDEPPIVIGAEPKEGNDASRSFQSGMIHKLPCQPVTMADGAMTMSLSKRTFQYVQRLHSFHEVDEDNIRYWTQWLTHLLKMTIEPTSAMPVAAAHNYLTQHPQKGARNILCIISGGNIAHGMRQRVWESDQLGCLPRLWIDRAT